MSSMLPKSLAATNVLFIDACMEVIEHIEGILRIYSECFHEGMSQAYWYHINKNIRRGDYE